MGRYHPDKVPDEEVEEAKEKFMAIQTARELALGGVVPAFPQPCPQPSPAPAPDLRRTSCSARGWRTGGPR